MTQTTPDLAAYADALSWLPIEWKRQDWDQVKAGCTNGKFILACADYPPIIFDHGE